MHECDYFMEGGYGGPPPENFEKTYFKTIYSEAFGLTKGGWKCRGGGGVIRFSHQICTDLKNGPEEFQKA